MVTLKRYYEFCNFDNMYDGSYDYIRNVSDILHTHEKVIKYATWLPCSHNYLSKETFNKGINQRENLVYAKTLELWNQHGYTAENLGNHGEVFLHLNKEMQSLFNDLATVLQIKNPQGKITIQPPGSSFPLHVDAFLEQYSKKYDVKENSVRRYCIFLTDWEIGHFFGIGKKTLNTWKTGDVIHWENNMPHATSNAGLVNKVSLNITGTINE